MQSNPFDRRTRGWYTISVDTVRGAVILAIVAAFGFAGWGLYRQWEARSEERDAGLLLDEIEGLLARAEAERPPESFVEEIEAARVSRNEAVSAHAVADYTGAVRAARHSRSMLLAILDATSSRSASGEAQFIAVQGGVEYRRGERGEWEEARTRVVLQSGDYVKTSGNGSAEIVFLDGTLYTVRPNTLFLVTRDVGSGSGSSEQTIAMEYGWVNLNTAQRGSRVKTPKAEAQVGRDSEVVVSYDRASDSGRFVAYRGELDVTSESGIERRVGALEQVVQTGNLLSASRRLPEAPAQVRPAENFEVSLDTAKSLELAWEPVEGASRYALQISRNRLFVDNLIDTTSRTRTSANLGLKGEGSFEWRVAALSRDGLQGPWSAPRSFHVLAAHRPGEKGDKTPPELVIDEVQAYGNIFIVAGRTELGAGVRVNGESVAVAANGTFNKTVLVAKEGWNVLELKATDNSGNESTVRRRVFVETF